MNAVAGRALWLAADLAVVVAVALVLAHWTIALVSPRAIAAPQAASGAKAEDVRVLAERHLFGASSAAASEAPAGSRLRLVGVVAPNRALVAVDGGKARSVAVGESVAPGVVLLEVHAEEAVVTSNGAPERLRLPRRDARR